MTLPISGEMAEKDGRSLRDGLSSASPIEPLRVSPLRASIPSAELALFVRESNWIEGIRRYPTQQEIEAHQAFLARPKVTLDAMVDFVSVVQPNARLRDRKGLNVYVGDHVPPAGGYGIALALCDILDRATDAYQTHVEYETLHPFTDGNGRSGRVLWLRMMGGDAPLGFLHHWYYQSLAGSGFRGKADTLPAQAMSAGTAETLQAAQGDSPPARSEGCASTPPASDI